MKFVYIILDPLHETVVCVHDKPNVKCDKCNDKKYSVRQAYHLVERKHFIVETK